MSTVFDKTVCLSVTFHRPYAYRRGGLDRIETEGDKRELRLTKRIFASENYRRCERLASEARKWIERRAVPSPLRDGTYLIPQALLAQVNEKLDEFTAQYNEAADAFAAEYPQLIEGWKEKLLVHYDERNYPKPNTMRQRFGVNRMLLDFKPACPEEIDQSAEIQQAMVEIQAALRAGLLQLVEKMAGMLGERADGKKRGFQGRALEAFNEWMELFPSRLVVDDDQLKKLADKARKLLEGKSVDDLRDIERVRGQVRNGLEKVGDKLRGMLRDMPTRAFSFNDDE